MFVARRAGTLPQDAAPRIAGLRLPAGRLIVPDAEYAQRVATTTPVLWMTEEIPDAPPFLAAPLAEAFAETGLWPLILGSLEGDGQRPWFDGELDPGASTVPDDHVAAEVLAEWWRDNVPAEDDAKTMAALAPFGRAFPGVAPASPDSGGAFDFEGVGLEGHLGLVAVRRPADVVTAIGWTGPINAFSDMAPLAAVLRSWEDRFGAYVVGVDFATLTLGVTRPPTTVREARAIAAEHFAMSPDTVHQMAGTMEELARGLVDAPTWTIWWD